MQDIKSREIERSKYKHKDMFRSSSHHSTSPPSEGFSLRLPRTFQKGTSSEESQLTTREYTTPTQSSLLTNPSQISHSFNNKSPN